MDLTEVEDIKKSVSKREQLYPEVDAEGSGLAVLLGAEGRLG